MRVYSIKGFADEEELRRQGSKLFEIVVRKMHHFLLRKLSTIEMPSPEKDVAIQYDITRMHYNIYHTVTVLNARETRALANFLEVFENTKTRKKKMLEAAHQLFRILGPYEFSPDVKEGEFDAPLSL